MVDGQPGQFGAEGIPAVGRPAGGERLHEGAVEGERQERGVAEAPGEPYGLVRGPLGAQPPRLGGGGAGGPGERGVRGGVARDSTATTDSIRARRAGDPSGPSRAAVRAAARHSSPLPPGSSARVHTAGMS